MIPATLDPATEALAHRVIDLALEVHTVLGPGLLKTIYEEALVIELQRAEIPVLRQGIARVINSAARPTPTLPAPSPAFPPLHLASRPSPPSRPSR